SPAHQLLLIVGSIEVLHGDLDIERFPGRSFLRQPVIEGLALLLLLGRGAERVGSERAGSLLDHRLQFFSRVLVGGFAALTVTGPRENPVSAAPARRFGTTGVSNAAPRPISATARAFRNVFGGTFARSGWDSAGIPCSALARSSSPFDFSSPVCRM